MIKKKSILILLCLLFFLPASHAIFFDNFNDTNGLDLNVHDADWNSFANTTSWYNKIVDNNLQIYSTNDGTGGTASVILKNNDINSLTNNQVFTLEFMFRELVTLAGGINEAHVQLVRPSDSNIVVNTTFLVGTTKNETYQIVLKKKSQNFIYDINILVNGTLSSSLFDQNLNTDSFRPKIYLETNGVSTGQAIFRIDDLIFSKLNLPEITYTGFGSHLGKNYTNVLGFSINYICETGIDLNVNNAINDVNNSMFQLVCDDTIKSTSSTYTHASESLFNIKFYAKNITQNLTTLLSDVNFFRDINGPTVDINFSSSGSGFTSSNATVTAFMTCFDAISPKISYDLNNTTTSSNALNALYDANSTQSGIASVVSGENIFVGRCTDLAGNIGTDTNTVTSSSMCFLLVDELTGIPLTNSDINNFTSLTLTSYNTGDVNDFKSPLHNTTCFASIGDDTLRFDINYSSGTQLYKEFNLGIIQSIDNNITVCIADDQDFFEQLFKSSQQRQVVVQNQISECYALADYTKYALEDGLSHTAFTIQMPYTLTTSVDGNTVILALINGAIESTTNLDVLVFKNQVIETGLQPDELTIALYTVPPLLDSNTVGIYYDNLAENNLLATIKIFDGNTQIYTQTISNTPNAFTVYFDTTLIDVNSEVLKIQVIKTLTDGSSETITRYFTLSGSSAIFAPGLGILFAFIIVLFGFTIIRWSYVLGWFGLLVVVAGIAILGFSGQSGPVIFLQAVLLIAGVYIFIIYKDDTVRTT